MTPLERPNIMLVVFDSLSEPVSATMADNLTTLSHLRETSVCFSNTYVSSPEGGPARASLFTGLDMAAHGVWTDGVPLPQRETTFTQRFAQSGYRTWLVGRRHLAGVSNWTTEHERAFEYAHLEWAHGPLHRSRQNAYHIWLQEKAPETYARIFPMQANPDDTRIPDAQRAAMASIPDDLCFNHWAGSRAVDLISSRGGDQPFLGMAGLVVGETMGADPSSRSCCEATVERALHQADVALGAIIKRLESDGLADSTVVVVTAGRGSVSDADVQTSMPESAIKVPLIIHVPGCKARLVDATTSTIDVAPTLYELARVSPPMRVQGMSLLSGEVDLVPRGWALTRLRNPDCVFQTALCSGRFKLVMSHSEVKTGVGPVYGLYDLQSDPNETTDLASNPAHQHDLEAMIDLMIDARVALEDRTEPRIAKF